MFYLVVWCIKAFNLWLPVIINLKNKYILFVFLSFHIANWIFLPHSDYNAEGNGLYLWGSTWVQHAWKLGLSSGSILTLTRLVEQRLSTAVVFNCGCHWHYSRVMVTAITHHLAPWARDTQTEPRVSVETDRSWVHRYTHCCHDGWAESSASPPHSCGDIPGPGSVLFSPELWHQRERQGSSRLQRTSPWRQRAVEGQSRTG